MASDLDFDLDMSHDLTLTFDLDFDLNLDFDQDMLKILYGLRPRLWPRNVKKCT